MYNKCFKRGADFVISLLAIILLSPVFAVLAVLIRIKLGSPVIFKQQRPGKDGKVFCLYKFRTMTDERNSDGNLLPDEYRLTRFGALLRKLSLDELPELVNILKGDMAIVGPRPLLVEYLDLYSEEQAHRHDVRPGLTGWAQVNGRNAISWEKKFMLDVEYVHNVGPLMDIKIIFMTVSGVLKRDGINSDTSVTMEKFTGSKAEHVLESE